MVTLIICLMIGLIPPVPPGFAGKNDFRNTSWGMTRLEVMASEEKAPESFREPYIHYKPEVLGRDFHLIYEFIENKLIEAVYIVTTRDATDYLRLKKRVETKYGKPMSTVDTGYRNYRFVWISNTTEIVMTPGRNRQCRIEYTGKQYKHLKTARRREISEKIRNEIFQSF